MKKVHVEFEELCTNFKEFEKSFAFAPINYSTSIGFESGKDIRIMSTAVGHQAMQYATGGGTHIGLRSGRYSTVYGNTGVGRHTMSSEGFVGDQNVAVGEGSMWDATTASNNAMVGNGAGHRFTTASRNVGLGLATLASTLGSIGCVAIGEDAMSGVTEDLTCTVSVGQTAGRYTESNFSVFLGFAAGINETRDNTLLIANNATESLVYGEFDNRYLKVNGDLEAERVLIEGATLYMESGELKINIPNVGVKVITLQDEV